MAQSTSELMVMLHEPIFNVAFKHNIVGLKIDIV